MVRTERRLAGDRGGIAAVEFALIAPLLALLAFGILQYGVYFGVAHAVQQVANDAARVAVAGLTDEERTAIVSSHVAEHAEGFGMIRGEALAVDVDGRGGVIRVRARYDASYLPIFVFDGLVPTPPSIVEARASVRIGGL